MRPTRKMCVRLDPADDSYLDKPKRMRWDDVHLLRDKLAAANDVVDEKLVMLAARLLEQ
jgi:hypothetical protein